MESTGKHDGTERYRSLYENMFDGYAYCRILYVEGKPEDFVFLDVNPAFERLTGLRNVVDRKVSEIIPGLHETNPELLEIYGKVARTSTPEKFETNISFLGLWFSIAVFSTVKDHFVAVFEDITERKRTEALLQESERKYRELVENANSIILRWGRDGKIAFMNEFGLKFFGYSEKELIGRHWLDTIVPATESTGRDLSTLIERIRANPKAFEQNINENVRRNGERVWISWTNKPVLDQEGRVLEVFSIGSDITERINAERELDKYREHLEEMVKERTLDLEQANIKLRDLDRLKSMFIASMSHELRTPLNSIIGFTGIILQGMTGTINEEQRDQLQRVSRAGKHLLALITDVIDISKIEAGKIDVYVEEFPLDKLLNEAASDLKPEISDKGLDLHITMIPREILMKTDRKRLFQCVLNYLSNAVKFTEKGSITLIAAEKDDIIEITVKDTGIGINNEDIPKLFQSFARLDSKLRISKAGTGLGLYLTRKLATEVLGGTVAVTSSFGEGSTFSIKIPKELKKYMLLNETSKS